MARGWHYTKLSLSSALLLSFSSTCFMFDIVPFFLSFLFRFVLFFMPSLELCTPVAPVAQRYLVTL